MASPSPACTVNGTPAPPGVPVTGGSTPTIALANPTGALFWFLLATQCDETTTLSAINTSLAINQIAKTATFTAPSTLGSCVIFQSTVGIGQASQQGAGRDAGGVIQATYTTTFKVDVLTSLGLPVMATNETFEENATFGWIVELNQAIRAVSGNILNIPGFVRLTNGTASGTPTVTSASPNQSGLVALCDTTAAWTNSFRLPTAGNAPDAFEITLVDSKNKWPTNGLPVTTDSGTVPIVNPANVGGTGATGNSITLSDARASARFKYDKTQGLYLVV